MVQLLLQPTTGGVFDYCRHEENALVSYRYENRLAHDISPSKVDRSIYYAIDLALEGEKEAKNWTWERSITAFEKTINGMLMK